MSVVRQDTLTPSTPVAASGLFSPAVQPDEAALWVGFSAARTAKEFCQSWLALQCRELPGALHGLLLMRDAEGRFTPAAVWPNTTTDVQHLAAPAREALEKRTGIAVPAGEALHVAYPIETPAGVHGVVVVELAQLPQSDALGVLRRLHWGAGWMETLLRRREAEQDQQLRARNDLALDMIAKTAEHANQREAGTAVATSLAVSLGCNRVSVGIVERRAVRLFAISHQANFHERAQIVDAIENAMEEALDQDCALAFPPTPTTGRRITLAQAELARIAGARSVISVPLASAGRPIGVLTLERGQDEPFTDEDIAKVTAVAVAIGPLVEARARAQRLIAGTLVDKSEEGLKQLFGPRRPGLKLAVGLSVAALLWLGLAKDDFRVGAKTVIEGAVQRAAVAPFDGFVAKASIRAGDRVTEGQPMASLDDRDLAVEAARWRAERDQQLLKYQEALGKQDRAQARILSAQIRQAEAQLELLETKLARAVIRAPFAGLVVSGDLSQMLGAPVETGKVLFEVTPLDSYRAVLQVDERDVAYVKVGQTGALRLAGQASVAVPVRITKVTPVASAADGRNAFRVEADLVEPPAWVRPGMEGVSKIEVDRRALLWVWTRSMIDWLRLATWTWWP